MPGYTRSRSPMIVTAFWLGVPTTTSRGRATDGGCEVHRYGGPFPGNEARRCDLPGADRSASAAGHEGSATIRCISSSQLHRSSQENRSARSGYLILGPPRMDVSLPCTSLLSPSADDGRVGEYCRTCRSHVRVRRRRSQPLIGGLSPTAENRRYLHRPDSHRDLLGSPR